MKKMIVLFFTIGLLASCSPVNSQEYINLDSTKVALEKTLIQANENYFALVSATPVVIIKEITQTPTPTLANTPTITNTPTNTFTPVPTQDPLKKTKGNGFYLIGVDIAPGIWRSQGSGDGCYWAVTRATGDIIANHFGMSGGTAYIPESGFQVEFNDCGMWEFISNP
jgi:hypothetical protein